jgi:hypothetical chaperone protein
MYLGIDFGTTNTVAAVIEDDFPIVLPLDEHAPDAKTLRTMLYIERDGAIRIGSDAIQTYRRQNVGRTPRFSKQWVGEIEVEIGEFGVKGYDVGAGRTAIVDVFNDVDADAPGRLMHALKGPLATDYAGTRLFGKDFTLEALIAEFLARLREHIARFTGRTVQRAVFGRPVHFANAQSDEDDLRAQARLEQAARLAGFEEITFEMEPVGAGLSFALRGELREGNHALVFDFGGGTLDVAVLRIEREGQRVLAISGIGVGGDSFDQIIFKRALLPWFGSNVRWGPQRMPLPTHIFDALGDWQDIPALCNPATLKFIREAQADCSEPLRLFALEDLISKGYAYALYERVERAKVELTSQRFSVIGCDLGAASVWQPLTRVQFESFIARERRVIVSVVADALQRAAVQVQQVACVVRTGGSSSIPCFVEMLGEMFGREKVVEQDLFTGVAAGLAIKAKQLGLIMDG